MVVINKNDQYESVIALFCCREKTCTQLNGLVSLSVIWVPVDLIFLDKWTRYLVTPHLVLVWALSASFQRNFVDMTDPLKQHTLALLAAAVLALLVKIVFMIYRGLTRGKSVVEPKL